ncbi:MAG: iron chelate uptake ABC transporter family permease subunit [Candidatus Bathyarchaeia archaeon]
MPRRAIENWKRKLILLILILLFAIIISLNIGYAKIPATRILRVIVEEITPFPTSGHSGASEMEKSIIIDLRLPRILGGALIGLGLSTAGVVFQGVFRNPMADPYVIGVSSGAALGAALAIVLNVGFTVFGVSTLSVMAFLFSLTAVFIVFNLARTGPKIPVTTLLLSGLAVSIMFSAFVSLLQLMSGWELHRLVYWMMGGLSGIQWRDLKSAAPLILGGVVGVYLYSRDLNIMTLSEEEAQHLGVNVERSKRILLALGSLITAASVSISGLIGFVGLIIPHLTRIMVGPDHRVLTPASITTGATFLVACDSLARSILPPLELPVGLVTSLTGAPFFLYLLRKRGKGYRM